MTAISPATQRSIVVGLKSCFAQFRQVRSLLDSLQELLDAPLGPSEERDHLVIIGETGTGKSTLLKHFSRQHPAIEHPKYTEVPVVYVPVPDRCTANQLVMEMLRCLGSPFWASGKPTEQRVQLITLLKACKVRVVLLDEVNHLADRGAAKTHYAVGDRLKSLTNDAPVSFVLAGIPSLQLLLQSNEQLRDRFRRVREIQPFGLETVARVREARSAFKAYQNLMGELPAVKLWSPEMARTLVFATGGRLRPLRKLLVRAVELAFRTPVPQLGLQELESAFCEVIFPGAPAERNPFSTAFNGLPLTKFGEPFGPSVRS